VGGETEGLSVFWALPRGRKASLFVPCRVEGRALTGTWPPFSAFFSPLPFFFFPDPSLPAIFLLPLTSL